MKPMNPIKDLNKAMIARMKTVPLDMLIKESGLPVEVIDHIMRSESFEVAHNNALRIERAIKIIESKKFFRDVLIERLGKHSAESVSKLSGVSERTIKAIKDGFALAPCPRVAAKLTDAMYKLENYND